jgi:NADH dehydrogenase FAD-containing subunit
LGSDDEKPDDAALLRNRVLALLEEANLQSDSAARRRFLTFVTAGGGFAGAETTGAINDFVRETVRYYPNLTKNSFESLSFTQVIFSCRN